MSRHQWLSGVVLAGVLAAACGPTVNVEEEQAALRAADAEWSQAAQDPEKFASYVAADGTVHFPGMPKATGTAAIRDHAKQMMSTPGFSVKWTASTAEVSASGDIGYTVGAYTATMNNPAGNAVSETGKYVTIWKKQADGSWKVVEDIFNADTPPPAPTAPHAMMDGSAITWGDPPPVLPAGARFAVIAGDPSKPGPFAVRLQFPSGYRVQPHWHPTDENVTVLSGTMAFGMGEKFDESSMKELAAGGYVVLPATMRHSAMARTAATIQIEGVGPFVLNYVNPADDPSKGAAR